MQEVSRGSPGHMLNNTGEPAAPNLQGDDSLTNTEEMTVH